MDETRGGLPLTHAVHPRTRASLEEALADEKRASAELVGALARAAPDRVELLNELIARKRRIVAALSALRAQLAGEMDTDDADNRTAT